ncbi:LOW QUALITY PROTEIN: DNA excision repair protein ERCC-6-like [Cylas formicarius]|uniref:LOW QUALITY PROTEIN: DNA excision repair protein ERCC-6-like n=1 Tax=Cylas formicarius TaxID=197179 RepID=UPI0029586363|nr:LOW QUALITY PROTEIN: DNA excision repair protein ERCC-6-like [Cylas formicarius]
MIILKIPKMFAENSKTFTASDMNEIEELKNDQGIQVWGQSQESLENQAALELALITKESSHEFSDAPNTCHKKLNVSISTQAEAPLESQTVELQHSISEHDDDFEEHYSAADNNSGSEYVPSADDTSDHDSSKRKPKRPSKKSSVNKSAGLKKSKSPLKKPIAKYKDDALVKNYKARLDKYYKKLEEHKLDDLEDESDVALSGGLKVHRELWERLYGYQQDGVEWLWDIHQKSVGGLLGDEMGLGKTVQVIVFLHSLQYSRIISSHCRYNGLGPTMIVCPATIIHQWVKHFHEWAPEFRVAVLHQSGTHQGNKTAFIKDMNQSKGVIITTYAGLLKYKGNFAEYNWHYLILDEGHKVRNPSAKVTVAAKGLRTPHRIMLTGSPMQNNLVELWSLFDFTNPGILGDLATFQEHFISPILKGGFANSSSMQEATALSVASTLKNIISPYLLRRSKNDVQNYLQLPNKSEQVLFCTLTDDQKDLYKNYLLGERVTSIIDNGSRTWRSENALRANMLVAITALRKLCNHPDLFLFDENEAKNDDADLPDSFGYYKKSGKMVVVSALLKIWKRQRHRVLLFSQGRSMIKIFEQFLVQHHYTYLKMDGSTSVASRQGLIDKFNQDSSYDVFLLTTRVGGLGVNLTGADRVIIYDPDWNPATDTQARERAWRIGQDKSVTIYRLLSAGTIEEKMYQRQVWKQLLSNKILIDPSTNKFFKSSDLFDLFSLPSDPKPETTNIFQESRVRLQEKYKEKQESRAKRKLKNRQTDEASGESIFTEERVEAMKALARQIAKGITANPEPHTQKAERLCYLTEKQRLRELTPPELVKYNRLNFNERKGDADELVAGCSFEKALEASAKTSLNQKIAKEERKRRKRLKKASVGPEAKRKKTVDTSGKIDGVDVTGLVKREVPKREKRSKTGMKSQDSYILEHLFSKKGVSGALEHESVVNQGVRKYTLKIREEAERKASKALEALKKSRFK